MHGTTKLTVNVPTEALEGLRAHAVIHRVTMTEALRQALGLQSFLSQEVAQGGKILIESRQGDLRELITV